jgi:DNA-binding transcriptional ArsR family regulator
VAQETDKHFPLQVDGDLVKDGVCGCLIARKFRVSQPTTSEHMKILCQAGLTRAKRIKKWTFYRRDEARIRQIKKAILAKIWGLVWMRFSRAGPFRSGQVVGVARKPSIFSSNF